MGRSAAVDLVSGHLHYKHRGYDVCYVSEYSLFFQLKAVTRIPAPDAAKRLLKAFDCSNECEKLRIPITGLSYRPERRPTVLAVVAVNTLVCARSAFIR